MSKYYHKLFDQFISQNNVIKSTKLVIFVDIVIH